MFTNLESRGSPKTGASDHFFPELLASAKDVFTGINLSLSPDFLSLRCALTLSFALQLSTSPYYLLSYPQWPPLCIQPLPSGSFSQATLLSLSPRSQVWYVPHRKVGRTFQLHVLSPAIGKQWLLTSPYFLSLKTCSFSSYYFFSPLNIISAVFSPFLILNTSLMIVFAEYIKAWGIGESLFIFFLRSLLFGSCLGISGLAPSFSFVSISWQRMSCPRFLLACRKHSRGFSANFSFIDLDFHVHLKHFLFTWKFLDVLSLSCFALLLNYPPTCKWESAWSKPEPRLKALSPLHHLWWLSCLSPCPLISEGIFLVNICMQSALTCEFKAGLKIPATVNSQSLRYTFCGWSVHLRQAPCDA